MRRAHMVALPTRVHGFKNQWQAEGAGGQHHEFAVTLLNFRAAYFQQACNVQGLLTGLLSTQHAQHHHLQSDDVDFELGDFIAKTHVIKHAFCFGDALQTLEFAFGAVHVSDVGALVRQQVFGVIPAFVFLADQVFGGYFHVVKPDFVDLAFTVQQFDGTHADAGRLHVDQQKRNTRLRFAFCAGAHQTKNPLTELAQRGPGFLAVDDEFVANPLGACFQ